MKSKSYTRSSWRWIPSLNLLFIQNVKSVIIVCYLLSNQRLSFTRLMICLLLALAVKLTTGRFIGDYCSGNGKLLCCPKVNESNFCIHEEMVYKDTAKDLHNPKYGSIEILDSSSEVSDLHRINCFISLPLFIICVESNQRWKHDQWWKVGERWSSWYVDRVIECHSKYTTRIGLTYSLIFLRIIFSISPLEVEYTHPSESIESVTLFKHLCVRRIVISIDILLQHSHWINFNVLRSDQKHYRLTSVSFPDLSDVINWK